MATTHAGSALADKVRRLAEDPIGVIRRKNDLLKRRLDPVLREEDRLSQLTGPSGHWKELRSYQLQFLKSMGLQSHHSLLDIACGPLQGGVAFISYLDRDRYVGVDICKTALTEAYMQLAKFELVDKNPLLICSDSFGNDYLNGRRFDFAWCCQTLYIFDEPTMDRFFASLSARLKPDGRIFGDILSQTTSIPEAALWRGFRHLRYSFDHMERIAARHGFAMTHVGPIHQHGYPVPCDLRNNDMLQFTRQ